jgi:hypothetical protein
MITKVINIMDIPTIEGLYIINIEKNIIKVGRSINLRQRIISYKNKNNIGYILCDSSISREKAMIYFITTELRLKPIYGKEYFTGDRLILEKIVTFFSSIKLEYINEWCNSKNTDYFKDNLKNIFITKIKPQDKASVICDNLILDLTYDRVINIMKDTKPVLEEIDPGLFFIKNICINEDGNVLIKCTDKKRKIFKLINKYKKEINLTGDEIYDLFIRCYYGYKNEEHINDENEYLMFQALYKKYKKKEFLDRVISLTHIDSPQTLIKKE